MDLLSDTRGFRVNRRCGAATNCGVNYENYMFLMLLMRLLEDENVERFYIAQNVEEVGAFDDLVFLVKYKPKEEDTPITKLFLVQLKHMNRSVTLASLTASSGSGHFNLNKYYNGFKSVMKNIGKFKDVVLNECQIEDMTFVVYTNARCPFGGNNYQKDFLCRELLETGGEESNIFRFDSSKQFEKFHKDLENNNSPITKDKDGEKFLHQLVFFSGQSTTSQLEDTLKAKLGKYFGENDIKHEDILHRAINFVTENNGMWMSQHSGVLHAIIINYQGFLVKLDDMRSYWANTEIYKKIIIKHICQEKANFVSVGKVINHSEENYIERKVERDIMDTDILDDHFVILSAPPGMGKSFFFTKQAYEVKKLNPGKYVIRENLLDHTSYLQCLNISDNLNLPEQFLTEIADVKRDTVDYDILMCCLKSDNNMFILLDGMDEINPDYFDKVCHIIQNIRAKFRVQLWVSTRSILEEQVKKYFQQEFWMLKEFTLDDIKIFLKSHCREKYYDIDETEEKLCVNPLFCKMMGDIIVSSNLEHFKHVIRSKVELYDRYIEVKFEIYYKDKGKVDISRPAERRRIENDKKRFMKEFEMAAMLLIFGKDKLSELKWNIIDESTDFLDDLSQGIDYMGLINKIKADQTPIFIHQSIAEYLCGRYFARNLNRYKEYVQHPGYSHYSFPKEVDYFMSLKLNNVNPLFSLVLNVTERNDIENLVKQYTSEFNVLDPLERNILHYVNIVNNFNALKYILFNGYILTDEIVTELNMYTQELTSLISMKLLFNWVAAKMHKFPQHSQLLGLLLLEYNLEEYVPYFLMDHSKNSPLHVAILNHCEEDIVNFISTNINSRNDLNLTPLHVATWMDDIKIVKLLAEQKAEYSKDNVLGVYPHQLISKYATRNVLHNLLKQFYGTFMQEDIIRAGIMSEDYILQDLPLHNAAQKNELREYLKTNSSLSLIKNIPDSKGRTVLHVAAASSCDEILGVSFIKIEKSMEYTLDDNGYFPHSYAECNWSLTGIRERGLSSIYRCLPAEDTEIKGIKLYYLLNRVSVTSDVYLKPGGEQEIMIHLLLRSIQLKLVNEDPIDRFKTAQNVDEVSTLYNLVFCSKYKPPGRDQRLLKQYIVLKNHMQRKICLAFQKLNLEERRLTALKSYHCNKVMHINFVKFEDLLNEHTLEEMSSIILTYVISTLENDNHHNTP